MVSVWVWVFQVIGSAYMACVCKRPPKCSPQSLSWCVTQFLARKVGVSGFLGLLWGRLNEIRRDLRKRRGKGNFRVLEGFP